MENNRQTIERITAGALVLLIICWGIPSMNLGIDVQDTSSYLTKYRYFFEQGVGGNALYYLIGEFLGSLIYQVFPRLLALNIAGYLVYLMTGYLTWRLLKGYLPRVPLLTAILAGCTFGISWVRCVNWNAWSMFFLMAGLLMLMQGLKSKKRRWFFLAGTVLGWNAFVRMPNIFFLILVFVVVFYGLDENLKEMFRDAAAMTAGGIFAGVTGVLFSISVLGMDKFLADFFWLLNSGGDTESKHNFFDMFANVIGGCLDGTRQWIKYGAFLAVLITLVVLIQKKWKKDVSLYAGLLSGAAALILGFTREVYVSSCPSLLSVQNFIAYGGVAFGIFGAFYFYKKDKNFAAICAAEMLIMLAMTMGTDTGSIFFRVNMGLPAAVIAAILWKMDWKPVRIAAVFVLVLAASTGLNCGWNYVYHDGSMEELTAQIDAPVFAGMKTTEERAEYVNRLMKLLEPYEEKELLTIGAFNIGCNVTDMKPFFDSAWADLDYLTMEEFHEVLQEKLAEGNVPVIVIATEKINGPYWVPEKIEYLEELVSSELYGTLYTDEWYSVYVPALK
ncbi:MAG: glycosyltransferase family 39 protein [Lachnospiraceae bacterium]